MRKLSFKIRKVRIAGKNYFQISVPNPEGGRPKRKTFSTLEDAKTALAAAKIEKENYGAAAFGISDTLRTDAVRAAEILKDTGATLVEAARHFLKDFKMRGDGVPIRQAVDAFLADRAGLSPTHLSNLKTRLCNFARRFEGKTTATITPEAISAFLADLNCEPRTLHHYWTHLAGLFRFCIAKKWAVENPMGEVKRPKVVQGEVEILTPEQVGRLLEACDHRILAGVVIAVFCGLRQSEVKRLDWGAVEIPEDGTQATIRLSASQVKTKARRVVPLPSCAVAWLLPVREKSGRIWPKGEATRDLWTQARIRAGFGPFRPTSATARKLQTDPRTQEPWKNLKPWPENALRHSALSYKLALNPDLARLAYESGNSPDVIREYYNGLALPKQAVSFFALLPADQGKIVRLSA